MKVQDRWEKEREENSKAWRDRALKKAAELGISIEIPNERLHARSKVSVTCEHMTILSPLYSFCSKVCCCRIGSNMRRTFKESSRRRLGESNSRSWESKDRFWADPDKLSEEMKNRPDIFYVALKNGLTKVGRVKPSLARKWLKAWDQVIDTWEMTLEHSLKLERAVRYEFNELRPLDRSHGKGWTELFEINPNVIISFIENELSYDKDRKSVNSSLLGSLQLNQSLRNRRDGPRHNEETPPR